jgi:ferric-dicitrate binding protein FerR (iron transport regulator)
MANQKNKDPMGREKGVGKTGGTTAVSGKTSGARSKVEQLVDIMFMEPAPSAESLDKMRLWLIDPDKEEEKSEALYSKFKQHFKFNPEPVLAPALWPDLARRLGLDETPVRATRDPLATATEDEVQAATETESAPLPAGEVQMRRRLSFGRIAARTAAVLVPVAVVLAGAWWFTSRDAKPQIVEIMVPMGEVRTIALPDGSQITATGPANIAWDETAFADNRAVTLTGEALFDVVEATSDSGVGIPFSVAADGVEVTVLGTVFRMTPGALDASTKAVSLYAGSVGVKVDPTPGDGAAPEDQLSYITQTSTILTPGERLTINTSTGESQTELIPASEMAEHGAMPLLRFEEATLGDLILALELNYDRKFDLSEGIDPAGGKYSANFEGTSLDEVLGMLSRIDMNLSWKADGDTVRVSRK